MLAAKALKMVIRLELIQVSDERSAEGRDLLGGLPWLREIGTLRRAGGDSSGRTLREPCDIAHRAENAAAH